ncbi:NADH-quinone oxidoreductase subunit NuoK [Micromonospora sp. CB01531]|uniref:NADH-quinone oxidoreductase subunit NuoK n=1 Tax=Micromonospora sp. CB01531 TaxID=1718947 RepID=UPI00093D30E5|nr:NADH-quinone oxidoreductase subunit NuoK [Micromonospora sp. CB01531]OKI55996.1 NADH-quinone oxidoreductase subunit K [Micromonospora sp. CB01531]
MRPVIPYVTAALLFGLGAYGVLRRRNAVLVLMAVELMLNAVNLILVTADTTVRAQLPHSGQVFALFVIVLAAAEIGVGLAIVLQLYRLRASVAVDDVPLTEASAPVPAGATATRPAGPACPPSGGPATDAPEGEK